MSGLEIKIKPNAKQLDIISKIKSILNNKVEVKTRAQLNETLYKMLNTYNLCLSIDLLQPNIILKNSY